MTKSSKTEHVTSPRPARRATPVFPALAAGHTPDRDCPLCPRLVEFREAARAKQPDWFNAPVPSFGNSDAALLIIGLAPGLQGANRTGRPFTGDYAGDLLYQTLLEYGFADGTYERRPDDGLRLVDCRITNAVRCVPPQNKPLPAEIATCRAFLGNVFEDMPRLRAAVLLGRVSHESTLKALGIRSLNAPFAHGAEFQHGNLRLFDSYHCSRYNTNTRRLTPAMFRAVFASVREYLD